MHVLRIIQDQDADSPREYCNLGTMTCWHPRYILGDEQPKADPIEHMLHLVCEIDGDFEEYMERWSDSQPPVQRKVGGETYSTGVCEGDYMYNERIEQEFDKHYLWLPLYLMDHSGISMSTGSFGDPWDSGQVGFIYISKAQARKEYGKLTKQQIEKIYSYLKSEVETYDQYLTGDVWGFILEKHTPAGFGKAECSGPECVAVFEDETVEEVDSCWGFFGDDPKKNGMADHLSVPIEECEVREPEYGY